MTDRHDDGVDDDPEKRRPLRWADRMATRLADRLATGIAAIAAVVLLAMMVLTFADVFGRYVLNRPLPGGFELTQILLATLIFAGLPLVTRREEHVQVTLLADRLPPVLRRVQAAIVNLAIAGMLLVVSWRLWHVAARAMSYGDTTSHLRIPLGPIAYGLAGLTAIAAVLACANAVGYLFGAVDPERRADG